jgi:hypothetical protein
MLRRPTVPVLFAGLFVWSQVRTDVSTPIEEWTIACALVGIGLVVFTLLPRPLSNPRRRYCSRSCRPPTTTGTAQSPVVPHDASVHHGPIRRGRSASGRLGRTSTPGRGT